MASVFEHRYSTLSKQYNVETETKYRLVNSEVISFQEDEQGREVPFISLGPSKNPSVIRITDENNPDNVRIIYNPRSIDISVTFYCDSTIISGFSHCGTNNWMYGYLETARDNETFHFAQCGSGETEYDSDEGAYHFNISGLTFDDRSKVVRIFLPITSSNDKEIIYQGGVIYYQDVTQLWNEQGMVGNHSSDGCAQLVDAGGVSFIDVPMVFGNVTNAEIIINGAVIMGEVGPIEPTVRPV